MTKPDIAVVIPCYNHLNVLRRTLEALARQTLKPIEVVVVDDGSVEDQEKIVGEVPGLPVRWMRLRHNHGAPYARNEGSRVTSAPFLLFLDADAELVPVALELLSNTLNANPGADFAYGNFYWGNKHFKLQPFNVEDLKRRNYIHTSSLIRRSAFPGFDESLKKFQDWDLWLTMAENGSRGVWIDRDLMRIEPRHEGMSRWLPKIAHMIPWHRLGFQPKEIGRYREAEAIVRKKHGI
jgi:glycosyltransferase involved in cell wall biosynthesis